ncbi:hypothetical protein [Paraburkholderia tropica]|uniref:hypothetical protein n=1 Tax=Paraburkholderia tropica TaxID=92647 RepID=UPI0012E9967F|nr:hypothetical protein [Paraburkholderia tropica]
MMDMRNKSDIERFLRHEANWALVKGRNERPLFRFVGASSELVWMMALGEVKNGGFIPCNSPPSFWRRGRWAIAEVRALAREGRLLPVHEHGIPVSMQEENIPFGVDEELDKRRTIVGFIAKNWGSVFVADTDSYNESIRTAAEVFGVSLPTVRKLVALHLFYGGHCNALVRRARQMAQSGATCVQRRQPRVDINGGVQ